MAGRDFSNELFPTSAPSSGRDFSAELFAEEDRKRKQLSQSDPILSPEDAVMSSVGAPSTEPPSRLRKPTTEPEFRSYEPSFTDQLLNLFPGNQAKSANEANARRIAKERGISVDEAYRQMKEALGVRGFMGERPSGQPMLNPEGRAPIQAVVEAAPYVAEGIKKMPAGAAEAALRSIRGGAIEDSIDQGFLDQVITNMADDKSNLPQDPNYRGFQGLGKSLGFSLVSVVSAAVAGATATAATGGNVPLGVATGMTASGSVAYRSSKDDFLSRLRDKLNKDSERLYGTKLSKDQWQTAKDEFEGEAVKYGAWEAIPEALSNAIFLKAFVKPAFLVAGKQLNSLVNKAGSLAVENLTETATGYGQNAAEFKVGLTKDEIGIVDAFKQQFIQTAIMMGVMGGGMKGKQLAEKFYNDQVLPQINPGSALAKAIKADIDAVAYSPEAIRQEAVRRLRPDQAQYELKKMDAPPSTGPVTITPPDEEPFPAPPPPPAPMPSSPGGRIEPRFDGTFSEPPASPIPGGRIEPTFDEPPPAAPPPEDIVPGMMTDEDVAQPENLSVTPVTLTEPEVTPAPLPVTPVTVPEPEVTPITPIKPTLAAASLPETPTVPPAQTPKLFEPTPDAHQSPDMPVVAVPVKDLKLSEDVPQFKSGASAKGLVEPLRGKFSTEGVAPIAVWRRLDGSMEVISGRHRLDLAQRSGTELINAQVYEESQGFDANDASMKDAELNIRDEQGKVKDYVNYFKTSGTDKETADAKGLLGRAKGKRGFTIANQGSDALVSAINADQIGDEAAYYVAINAPNDERLQNVGIRAIMDGKSMQAATNIMQALKAIAVERDTTTDMFDFDDSGMKEADAMAKIASKMQNSIKERLAAITGAAKNPAMAKAEGIDVRDPNAVKRRIEELDQRKAELKNWYTSPELVAEIRAARGVAPPVLSIFEQPVTPQEVDTQDDFLSMQTPEELRKRAEAQAEAARQQAIAGQEAQRRTQADSEVDDFVLTGSDRDADEAAARGQEDLFGAAQGTEEESGVRGASDEEVADVAEAFGDAKQYQEDEGITRVFDTPDFSEIVRMENKTKGDGFLTIEQAKARIAEWKKNAEQQGETRENSDKIVLSLFDMTGQWSAPWEEAGYQVYRFDIQTDPEMGDVTKFSAEFFNDLYGAFEGQDVYAILAACPCTDFASSGARHFAAKDADGRTVESVELVQQTLRTVEYFKPSIWAIENPVGRIEKLTGLPPWRLSFNPNHFGDPYTKKTLLWGRFNADLPTAPVEAVEGSKMHRMYGGKSQATKNARSVTPEGFAYAFFTSNNAIDNPVMALANKYDMMDPAVIKKAVNAGMTGKQIANIVDDPYYLDIDYKAANDALSNAVTPTKGAVTDSQERIIGMTKKEYRNDEATLGKSTHPSLSIEFDGQNPKELISQYGEKNVRFLGRLFGITVKDIKSVAKKLIDINDNVNTIAGRTADDFKNMTKAELEPLRKQLGFSAYISKAQLIAKIVDYQPELTDKFNTRLQDAKHQAAVTNALRQGVDVTDEVIKDYPELTAYTRERGSEMYNKAIRALAIKEVSNVTGTMYKSRADDLREMVKKDEDPATKQVWGDVADAIDKLYNQSFGKNQTEEAPAIDGKDGKPSDFLLNVEKPSKNQINTPEFKRWFRSSKVVNEDGSPKVMYHGTNKDFNEFVIAEKANRTGMPDGFYFTSDANDASRYAEGEGANVLPVYLSIKNPYNLGGKNKISKEMVMQFRDELRKDNPNLPFSWIQEKVDIFEEKTAAGRFPFPNISFPTEAMRRVFEVGGYDGLIDGSDVFVAFNSNQVKSATGNRGTFGESANILENVTEEPSLAEQGEDLIVGSKAIREWQIGEYARLRAQLARVPKQVAEGKVDLRMQAAVTRLMQQARDLNSEIKATKPRRDSAEQFLAKAALEFDKGNISEDVFNVIKMAYDKMPDVLEGLLFSVKSPGKNIDSPTAGQFLVFERIVRLYKGTSGIDDPATIRHELAHSLEQMMNPEQRLAVAQAWVKGLLAAIKKNPDETHQKYFNAVMDFIDNPSETNFRKAVKLLPSYGMYQFINPSEFWAVNAESLMAAELGGAWGKFKRAIARLWEGIKNVVGFDNRYVVQKMFKDIMNGSRNRITTNMLVDLVGSAGVKFNVLENIEDDKKLLEKHNRPNTPQLDSAPLKTQLINAGKLTKDFFSYAVSDPLGALGTAANSVDRAVLYTRNKNVWFGSGLNAADFSKYNGELLNSQGLATASVALDNAIRGGQIATEVIFQGGIKFDPKSRNFVAVKRDKGMRGVYEAEAALKKRLGNQLGTDIIQGYLEAKRSRSIQSEYFQREAEYEYLKNDYEELQAAGASEEDVMAARDAMADAKNDLKAIEVAYKKINMSEEEIDEFIARDKVHPELRKIMENWSVINKNMLTFWRQVGLLSENRYENLSNIQDYVPWQRIMNDETDIHSPVQTTNRRMTNIGLEKLFKKGKPTVITDFVAKEGQQDFKIQPAVEVEVEINGDPVNPDNVTMTADGKIKLDVPVEAGDLVVFKASREIENIIDNMTRNVMRMTMNGLRQAAAQRIVMEYATRDKKNKVMIFPKADKERGRFDFIVSGERIVVEIQDPLIAESIFGMQSLDLAMLKPLAAAANITRRAITLSGAFQIKQVFKDAPTAALVTGVKHPLLLIGGVYKGFITSLTNTDPTVKILKAAGIGGFASPARTPEAEIKRRLGIMNRNVFDFVIKGLDHIGDSSDMAQRVATYKRVLAETGDETQALYQAANVINFLHHGSGQVAQMVVKTVPFAGAYANSMDVLIQALAGGGLKGRSRKRAGLRLAATATTLVGITLLYCMLVGDDEEYNQMDDQTKVRNFMIPGTKILLPMNTSAAYFFKAVPEIIYNRIIKEGTKDSMDRRRMTTALKEAAIDMLLGPTPVPSAIKPFIEIGLNKDFFTGRPVVPESLAKLDAAERYMADTSEAGKFLSSLTGNQEKRVLDPIEADHLIRGIFGTAGAMAQWFSNSIAVSTGERVAMTEKQTPLTGSFLRADVGRRNEDLFYDFKSLVDNKYGTYSKMLEREDYDKADDYEKKYSDILVFYKDINKIDTDLKEINALVRYYGESKDTGLTPDQRRQEIKELQIDKQNILEDTIEMRKEAGL